MSQTVAHTSLTSSSAVFALAGGFYGADVVGTIAVGSYIELLQIVNGQLSTLNPQIRFLSTDIGGTKRTGLKKTVPMDPPASRLPAVRARAGLLERELAALKLQVAECVLACAEAKPRARENLAELYRKISLVEFEIAGSGLARDLVRQLDGEAFAAWRADVQKLPLEDLLAGLTREQCCRRCQNGECIIGGGDSVPSSCLHPVLTGPLNSLRLQANRRVVEVYNAAVAAVGTRREASR